MTLSQRDVPGMTSGVIRLLRSAGVNAITIGVNGGSAPPALPPLFVWQSQNGPHHRILVIFHKGGYGGIDIADCPIVPGFPITLATAFRSDNEGPPENVNEILSVYNTLQKEFPRAQIQVSTFDNFVRNVMTIESRLPVVTQEIGDTWIHGIASDPRKVKMFREIMRLRDECLTTGICVLNDTAIQSFDRLLVKAGEHTWGLDVKTFLHDWSHWSNAAFHSVRNNSNFQMMEESWVEQRQYITKAIAALGTHPLAERIRHTLQVLEPYVPNTSGYNKITNFDGKKLQCGRYTLAFTANGGGISYLYDSVTRRHWASDTNVLAKFIYTTFSESDFSTFLDQYAYCNWRKECPWFIGDFGKQNCSAGGAVHRVWSTRATVLYAKESVSECSFLQYLESDPNAYTLFGAPHHLWLTFNIRNKHSNELVIDIDVQIFNKTSSRLPEALWVSFNPIVADPMRGWSIDKLGERISLCNFFSGMIFVAIVELTENLVARCSEYCDERILSFTRAMERSSLRQQSQSHGPRRTRYHSESRCSVSLCRLRQRFPHPIPTTKFQ